MAGSLAFVEIMLAQSALQQSGYYHGPVDGSLNKSTRQALMGFQKDGGLEVTGDLDEELFRRLMALRQERVYATPQGQIISPTNSVQVMMKNSREMRAGMLCLLTVGLIVFLYLTV